MTLHHLPWAALAASLLVGCTNGVHMDMSTESGTGTGTTTDASETDTTTTDDTTSPGSSTTDDGTTAGGPCGGQTCGAEEACIDEVCVDVHRSQVEEGCHPFATDVCMYPWPSNVYTRADAESPTGLYVDYKAELLPINETGDLFPVDEITNVLDGFSPNSQIRFVAPEGVDSSDLPPIDDIAASLEADSPIVLIDVDSGERWPFFAEVDALAADEPWRQAVFIRPMRRLDWGRRYAVGVRDLLDRDGAPLAPPPLFAALRDEQTTDVPELEALRGSYEEVFDALEKAGVDRGELQLAWDFTTITQETLQVDMRAIMTSITPMIEGGDLGFTVKSVDQPGNGVYYVIRGTYKVPNCMTGDASPGERLNRPDGGVAQCQGLVDAPFVAAVPEEVYGVGAPAPAAVYGHGLLGSAGETASVAKKAGAMILVGTDFWGMSEEDIINVIDVFTHNFENGMSVPERLLQSAVNFSTLAYLVAGPEFAQIPELNGPNGSLIQPGEVFYLGGSQGGIMGGTVVGTSPNLHHGALVVGAANYSLMVWRSAAFAEVNEIWKTAQPDQVLREQLFAIYQSAFDFSDPLTYAEQVMGDPLQPGPAKALLFIESIGDSQVPNIATEMAARTYEMQMLDAPVYPVYGVPGTTEPVAGHALLQVDTGNLPLPPKENLPPDGDNGAHGSAVDGAAARASLQAFFAGAAQNLCDGPCDPD
ncbi:MAG: hypothetical protein KC636_14505 [Myxococcales bacterium]|nr:hypothetical protein [Myxococcales bacterium]